MKVDLENGVFHFALKKHDMPVSPWVFIKKTTLFFISKNTISTLP